MRKSKRKPIYTLLSLSVLLVLCFSSFAAENSKLTYNLSEESATIDPQLVTGETGIMIDYMCMEGLTRLGKNPGEVIPGTAEKWDISEDGLTWTFYIRDNAKWSNGKPVTAHDFAYGMKRALDPNTAAQYASFLYYIKNAEEFNTEKIKDFAEVGIKVLDDNKLEITLGAPCPFFTQITAFPTSFPLNEEFYTKEIDGEFEYALDAETMLYNGPWKIENWLPGQGGKIEFKKNPDYWGKDIIKIDEIDFTIVKDDNTAANMFLSGKVDITRIDGEQYKRFEDSDDKKDIRKIIDGAVWYLEYNINNEYFKNEKIRNAFGLAIDRKTLCEEIRADGSEPAYAFVPYGTFGGKNTTFRDRFGKSYFKEDTTKAKKLLTEGLEELGIPGPVKVKLLLNDNPTNRKVCVYLQEQFKEAFGDDVEVQLDPTTFQNRLTKMHQNDFDFTCAGWGPDYDDPMTFMDLFTSWNPNNHTGWKNKEYDELIKKASESADNEKRMENMAKAEKILMKEMPIYPMYFTSRIFLVKPYVKDVYFLIGAKPSFYWAYIEK